MKRFNFDIKIVKEAIGGDALSKRPKFFHMRKLLEREKTLENQVSRKIKTQFSKLKEKSHHLPLYEAEK